MDLAPTNCFAIEADGRLVSTTTLLCYSQRLAWIGMVLTRANYRGRGFARRLLATALDRADSLGIETVKLDATDEGKPIYEKFGFKAEQPVERWSRPGSDRPSESRRSRWSSLLSPHLRELDFQAFGTDRSNILCRTPESPTDRKSTRLNSSH